MASPHAQIYALLREAAEQGRVCPTGREMTASTGHPLPYNAVSRLCRDGMIRRHGYGLDASMEIVATGRRTATRREAADAEVMRIVGIVARAAGLSPSDVCGRDRRRIYIRPRVLVCHFAQEAGVTSLAIGRALGRDHSTVIHACGLVDELLVTDKLFSRLFHRVTEIMAGTEPTTVAITPVRRAAPLPKQHHPIEFDASDRAQTSHLYCTRQGSARLLAAIRRAYPERCAA